jgi:hypothetical protein
MPFLRLRARGLVRGYRAGGCSVNLFVLSVSTSVLLSRLARSFWLQFAGLCVNRFLGCGSVGMCAWPGA